MEEGGGGGGGGERIGPQPTIYSARSDACAIFLHVTRIDLVYIASFDDSSREERLLTSSVITTLRNDVIPFQLVTADTVTAAV